MGKAAQDRAGTDLETGASGETTPLLSASPSTTSLEIAKHDTAEGYWRVARGEIRWMASSSSLVILTFMLQSSFFFVNVLSVSHLGARELAAMALSITCMGIIASAPAIGLASAMDTFCSTAHTASRDKTLVGFHFQRGMLAVTTHLVLVAPVLWNSERIFALLRQDAEIARLAGTYLRIQILGIWPWSMFECFKRYLQAQGIMRAGTIVVCVLAPVHWINNFFFVRSATYGVGFVGAPIVNVVSNWLCLGGILVYAVNSRARESWGGWDPKAARNMWQYYRLAIPSVVTVCAEWVGFELLTIGASYFGATQLAGQSITLNTVGLIFQLSNGLGYGTSPRVGNLIGAAKPRQARIAAQMALAVSGTFGLLGTLFVLGFGGWWVSVYTADPAVIFETMRLLPVACVFIVSDGLNAVLGAVLRGLGRQQVSANIYMFAFYVCAVPLSVYFAYGPSHLETPGLWWGLCFGVTLSSLLQFLFTFRWIDWKDEVRMCLERLKHH